MGGVAVSYQAGSFGPDFTAFGVDDWGTATPKLPLQILDCDRAVVSRCLCRKHNAKRRHLLRWGHFPRPPFRLTGWIMTRPIGSRQRKSGPVDAEGERRENVAANREAVEPRGKFLGQNGVGWDLAHHIDLLAVVAALQPLSAMSASARSASHRHPAERDHGGSIVKPMVQFSG
jgi:hypothetical protein